MTNAKGVLPSEDLTDGDFALLAAACFRALDEEESSREAKDGEVG
jgi:hypothetical protein